MTEDEDDAPALPAAKRVRAAPVGRKAVVDKLWRAARRQIAAHEQHLAELPQGSVASEADAKALATLARTVRELVMLDGAAGKGGKPSDDLSPTDGLRHAAALRDELARRLEALAAEEEAAAAEAAAPDGERG